MNIILFNGTIQAKVNSGGGLDENGNPIRLSDAFNEPISCRVVTNKKNNLGKQNGNSFIIASYEVLIELQPFDAGVVRLTQHGRELGIFPVICIERLEEVGVVKITV